MKHLRILLKANYLVDNYKHMKNFQALSQSDSLSRWAHAHFKQKNEKDGKTDLICTQLTHAPVNFLLDLKSSTKFHQNVNIWYLFEKNFISIPVFNLRNAHYN